MTNPLTQKTNALIAAPSGTRGFRFKSGLVLSVAKSRRFLAGTPHLPASFSFLNINSYALRTHLQRMSKS